MRLKSLLEVWNFLEEPQRALQAVCSHGSGGDLEEMMSKAIGGHPGGELGELGEVDAVVGAESATEIKTTKQALDGQHDHL